MKYSHGDAVALIDDLDDGNGHIIPSGSSGTVLASKHIGKRNYYTVSFPKFGLAIVEEGELN